MASRRNDLLRELTVEGPVNLYDNQMCKGTASKKGLAARLGGHRYNILTNDAKDEIYLRELRNDDHFIDRKNRHTRHFVGDRKRKFRKLPVGTGPMWESLKCPEDHPRVRDMEERRTQVQLAQTENSRNFGAFKGRCLEAGIDDSGLEKLRRVDNNLYMNEQPKFKAQITDRGQWLKRRGEVAERSSSCPSLSITAPQESLARAMREDPRKSASQRQNESANFATVRAANTYTASVDTSEPGYQLRQQQKYCSAARLENHDFAVTRKNNHYSGHDKLTRNDSFFTHPRYGTTGSSVKYDIVSNERRWFAYA